MLRTLEFHRLEILGVLPLLNNADELSEDGELDQEFDAVGKTLERPLNRVVVQEPNGEEGGIKREVQYVHTNKLPHRPACFRVEDDLQSFVNLPKVDAGYKNLLRSEDAHFDPVHDDECVRVSFRMGQVLVKV